LVDKMHPSDVRKLFDTSEAQVVETIERTCARDFLASSHYNYILALVLKCQVVPSMEQFKATRVLGEGGFGQVLEVVKRDCGKVYAMKVMRKVEIMSAFVNENWRQVVLLEQRLQASLHHPLLVNLAYSFQNVGYLVLVMDACPGGDLSTFALTEERLTPSQVRFVGTEVTAVLSYLHSHNILYRDIKPENLLLDAAGHIRLIDFGLAIAGEGRLPSSDEMCGTPCYMAPEVRYAGKKHVKKYSGGADWYTLGVLLYELTEQRLPFGEDPKFHDFKAEWRKPKAFVTESGGKDDDKYDLVKGLLEWRPDKRLGGGGKQSNAAAGAADVRSHKYWRAPEWLLVESCRLPSPLKEYVDARGSAKPNEGKMKKLQRAAVETAVRMASAETKVASNEGGKMHTSVGTTERELEVAGWDFVSPHAIEQEYVETLASSVSLI